MTDLTTRPRSSAPPAGQPLNMWLAGLAGAAVAAGLALLAVTVFALLAWAADARSGSGLPGALRAAAAVWLAANGTALSVPGGQLRLLPLGLTALSAVLLIRAGSAVARNVPARSAREVAAIVAAVAIPYAAIVTIAAAAAACATVRPAPLTAAVGSAALAALAAGYGVVRALPAGTSTAGSVVRSKSIAAAAALSPAGLRAGLRGAAAGAGVVLAGGALAVAVALASQLSRAVSTAGSLGPGWVGGLTLLMLQVALVPTVAIWGASYLLGPGFALGAGTSVSMFAVSVPAVPALPLLAAIPANGDPPWGLRGGVALPVAAGVIAGIVVDRYAPARRLLAAAGTGLGAGIAAACLLAGAAVLAGGSGGPGRLATVGPSPWHVGLAAAVELGLPAAGTAWIRVYLRLRPDGLLGRQLARWGPRLRMRRPAD